MIQLESIHKTYRTKQGPLEVLRDVSLEIPENSFTMLCGASGSGKSTLLNILGLLETFDSGKFLWDGNEIAHCTTRQRARIRREKTGFVFQSFRLIPVMTAFENVEMPLGYAGFSREERRRMTEAALEKVGLADRMHHLPGNLSGGEQQRAAIARAIIRNPRLILADEPTGNLDRETADSIMKLLRSLNCTVFMVTHDESLRPWADRLLRMKNGRLVEE